ncbi:MAG: GNAT family N-acetyltransferase [Methanobrevibacter sp.]|jgi:spore coat polysaccharide biosynthesis predicted glycosyltransferase SpsG/RimJ/RimL family protein N-acetyltransferase|nr:GNAT family N-acetyltransferase [Candidatus Methanovirga aequatorialis]
MKVVILTEGSKKKGFGHITRCISLYQSFKSKNIPLEFFVDGDSSVEGVLKEVDYKHFDWIENKNDILNMLNKEDIVVIDSYQANNDLFNEIENKVSFGVYLDDNKRIDYPGGLVVNPLISAENLNYPNDEKVDYLLGSDYALLREDFLNVPNKKINSRIGSILIILGGTDLKRLNFKILEFLVDKYGEIKKNFVIGSINDDLRQIKRIADENTDVVVFPDSKKILNLMLNSDIAISAGGQTLNELARVGVPTIAINVISNQENNLKAWENQGFIEFAGDWNDSNLLNNIHEKIELLKDEKLRFRKHIKGIEAVDGYGACKIVKLSLNKYYMKHGVLRLVNMADCYKVYEISNEREVRDNSFNNKRIDVKEHEAWFENKVVDENTLFLVKEFDDEIIGQIRFDLNEKQSSHVSISLNKKYRGLGLSNGILEEALNFLKSKVKDIKTVKGLVKENNVNSIRMFKSLGFELKKKVDLNQEKALEYVLNV